ncbi:hypothetical protein [Actinoplanes subglobosus]|uniref:Integral membrane protein n=1 Tax=Actinoplanes subglobosus TaxID=1547892 RepID=A0ABV8J083_9ACTN
MVDDSPWKETGLQRGAKIAFGFMALLAVVSAVLVVVSAVDGDLAGVAGFSAGAIFFGHLVGFSVHMWWRPRRSMPAVTAVDGAVTFPFSAWTSYWLGSFMILMVLVLVLIGSSGLLGGGGPGIVVAILAFGAAIYLGGHLVRLVFNRRGCLRLTPTRLEHHALGFTHRLPWDAVADVVPAEVNDAPLIILMPVATAPVDVTFTWITRGPRKGLLLPSMAIRSVWLVDDPVTVYRTLRHYHSNPGHRVELASGAAIDRIRQDRLTAR